MRSFGGCIAMESLSAFAGEAIWGLTKMQIYAYLSWLSWKRTEILCTRGGLWVLWVKHDSQNSGWQPHHHLLRGIMPPSASIVPQMQSVACLVLHLGFWFSPCYVSRSPAEMIPELSWLLLFVFLLDIKYMPFFNIKNWLSASSVLTGHPSVQFNLSQQTHTTYSELSNPTGLGFIPIKPPHFRHQPQVEFPDYPHFCLTD